MQFKVIPREEVNETTLKYTRIFFFSLAAQRLQPLSLCTIVELDEEEKKRNMHWNCFIWWKNRAPDKSSSFFLQQVPKVFVRCFTSMYIIEMLHYFLKSSGKNHINWNKSICVFNFIRTRINYIIIDTCACVYVCMCVLVGSKWPIQVVGYTLYFETGKCRLKPFQLFYWVNGCYSNKHFNFSMVLLLPEQRIFYTR